MKKPKVIVPRRGLPHEFVKVMYVPEAGVKITRLEIAHGHSPQHDVLTLKHDCCGATSVMTVASLRRRIKPGEREYAHLCTTCAQTMGVAARTNRERVAKTEEAFQLPPTWPRPAVRPPTRWSYYGGCPK